MTRAFMWVLMAVVLGGGAVFAARHLAAKPDAGLGRRVDELTRQVDALRDQLALRERAAAAAAGQRGPGGFLVPEPKKETIEEEEERVEREGKAQAVKETEYYARLDREMRAARPGAGPRAQVQSNVEALAAAKLAPAPLAVSNYECSETLCRVEVRRLGAPAPGPLATALRHLTRGMAEVTMRPFGDDGRSVIYAAPRAQKLPPMDL